MENLFRKNTYDLTGAKILIAEDDPISRMIVSKLLNIKNAVVVTAKNGQEAIDTLNNTTDVNIVLLDLEMPEMNGYETIKVIKEKLPAMPVLAMTANLIDGKMEKYLLQFGFSGSMSKPFTPQIFYSKIIDAINKESVEI